MGKNIWIGEILSNEEVQEDYFLMKIALPVSFVEPRPGQFVMVRVAGLNDPFLGRPLSIYSFRLRQSSAAMELLFRVVGKGTQVLAGLIKGSQLEIHGPLGEGYAIFPARGKAVFIAGGIGMAPLYMLARHLCQKLYFPPSQVSFYLGAQNIKGLVGLDRLERLHCNTHVCTDDGSCGRKALVTQAWEKDIKKYDPAQTVVYACGPNPMLKALAGIFSRHRFLCQVSLEERMACGTGACMGCSVAVRDRNGNQGYKRVCTDGPVFNLEDIIWSDSRI